MCEANQQDKLATAGVWVLNGGELTANLTVTQQKVNRT